MAAPKSSSAGVLVVTILLGVLFIYVGYVTFEYDVLRPEFDRWHYPDWLRLVLASLEIAAGAMLFYSRTTWIGALILAAIMVAGVATLYRYEGKVQACMPALLFISLSSLAYYRFPRKTPPAGPEPH